MADIEMQDQEKSETEMQDQARPDLKRKMLNMPELFDWYLADQSCASGEKDCTHKPASPSKGCPKPRARNSKAGEEKTRGLAQEY